MTDRDNITLPREVVQDALDALTGADDFSPGGTPIYMQEITALRTALAAEQPKPEPVAWFLPQPLEVHYYSAKNQALQREVEALRRDAERYRWLRTRACHGPHERFVSEYGWFDVSGQHEPGFDAAIDAAMGDKR